MGIDEEGFLSEDIVRTQQEIREKYAAYFNLITRINAFCQQTKYRLSIHNRDGQEVLAACLLIKLLNDVQAAVLLLERGLASPGRALLRVALEALFILANVCSQEDFYEAFIRGSEIDRLKLIHAIRKNPAPVFDEIRPHLTPELIEKLTTEIREAETSKGAVAAMAHRVGLGHMYDGAYRLLSQDVHSSPRTLQNYLVMDETGELKSIGWGPVTDDLSMELATAATIMLIGFGAVDQLFGLQLSPNIRILDIQLRAMIEGEAREK